MVKNIVVLSDGTGQEGGVGQNTNVYKLFNMLEDRTDRQVSFYDRGLGTGLRKITGNVAGMGISKNILECYKFIFDHYNAGDRIYLFGFSRGATTVRSLSGFIHLFGVLPKSRPELIKRAFRIYKIGSDKKKREKRATEFVKRHHTMWCRIKFLGVWDTVAALGIPIKAFDLIVDRIPIFKHKFHNLRLSKSVEYARHALAIDDERKIFHPALWDKETEPYQSMKQVWFCGMHTDVGGGYREQELSDIPLIWIVEEAKQHGLLLYTGHKVKLEPDPYGCMHNSRSGTFTRFYSQKARSWCSNKWGKPVAHKSVLMRYVNAKNEDNPSYDPWILKLEPDVEPWPEEQRSKGLMLRSPENSKSHSKVDLGCHDEK